MKIVLSDRGWCSGSTKSSFEEVLRVEKIQDVMAFWKKTRKTVIENGIQNRGRVEGRTFSTDLVETTSWVFSISMEKAAAC